MDSIDLSRIEGLYGDNPPSVKEAFEIQRELRKRVINSPEFGKPQTVAGADLAVLKEERRLLCGIILFSYPDMIEIERVFSEVDDNFPYIPGLLAFREGPAIIRTFRKLRNKPDLLMIDGQGIAHPRGFGIACHVGVLLDTPALGVAKKRLYGTFEEPGKDKGSWTPLRSKAGECIGAVLRTRDGIKPVFVSVGHKIDIGSARDIALACARGYRIPEPTRLADKFVAELKKEKRSHA